LTNMKAVDLARQVNFLIDRGMSSDEALQLIEKTDVDKSKSDLDSVKNLFDSDANYTESMETFHYRKNLKILMDIIDKYKGKRPELHRNFYNHFIKNESDFNLSIFDISSLLFYLIAIVSISIACVSIYSIFVLPQFAVLFATAGQELPALTAIVFKITSEYSYISIFAALLFIVAIFIFIFHIKKTLRSLNCFHPMVVKMPVIGRIIKKYNQYLQLSYIKLMMNSGLDGEQAINETVTHFGDDSDLLASSNPSEKSKNSILELALELGTVEEEIEYQFEQIKMQSINNFTNIKSIVSVMSIIIVSIVVGTVIIAMYLPLFQLGKILG